MAITASMVKDLREKTGAGMMDCKKALVAVDGDMEKAIDWLRQKGMAKAATKSGRATAEGLVRTGTSADGRTVAMASLFCETDFVARGDDFQGMVASLVSTVLEKAPADQAALEALKGDDVKQLIAKVGENMRIGKFFRHERASDSEVVGEYIHANGKIGVLVWMTLGKAENCGRDEVKDLAHKLAMQVAAAKPLALDESGLDAAAVERERELYRQKARDEGKPEQIIEKIAEGAVKKFAKTVCLLGQPYIYDDKKAVGDVVRETAKACGDTIVVNGFSRIELVADEEK